MYPVVNSEYFTNGNNASKIDIITDITGHRQIKKSYFTRQFVFSKEFHWGIQRGKVIMGAGSWELRAES